jgi:hypothetical protein
MSDQLVDLDILQTADAESLQSNVTQDTPSSESIDNNLEMANLQVPNGEKMPDPTVATAAENSTKGAPPNRLSWYKLYEKPSDQQVLEKTLSEIKKAYREITADLTNREQLKLKTLNKKIGDSYYHAWRVDANDLMRRLVFLKRRRERIKSRLS